LAREFSIQTLSQLTKDNSVKKTLDYWGLSGILLVVCISFLYILTAGTNGVPLITNADRGKYFWKIHDSDIYPEVGDHYGYYNLLADAFQAGRLSLPIEPKPELLALPNPYTRAQSAPSCPPIQPTKISGLIAPKSL
jgi:hypothetical protein